MTSVNTFPMSFPPQLLTSTQHYACLLNFSLFRVNYMKKHFDRLLLYEDPPHAVTTAKIELGLQKELQWLTPLFKLYGNIWLSHSNLSATWWQDGMGGLLVFKKSMGSCIMGNLGFSVGPGLGQKKYVKLCCFTPVSFCSSFKLPPSENYNGYL